MKNSVLLGIILWFFHLLSVEAQVTNDVGIVVINAPVSGCALGTAETVTVTVQNFGTLDQDTVPIAYRINGGAAIIDTIFLNVIAGNTAVISFSAAANLSVPGIYILDAWTILPGDTVPQNDSLPGIQIEHYVALTAFPVVYDLSSESACPTLCGSICTLTGLWTNSTDDDIDWAVDANGTATSFTGPSVDHTTGTSTGKYLYTEASGCANKQAILLSPCIDLGVLSNPYFEFFYYMYGVETGTINVDIYSGGIWINLFTISGQQQTNQTLPWLSADIDLGAYSGVVQLRIRGITGNGILSDMAIDDLTIYDKPENNVGVIAITTPNSGLLLSDTESVTVVVQNFGAFTQDTIPVSFRINGGFPVTDTVFTLLVTGDTLNYIYPGTIDLSTPGNYVFDAWTNLPGDQVPSNDSLLNKTVVNDSSATIGTSVSSNTNTTYPAPYGNQFTCAKHQIIIRASELLAKGLNGPGYINTLAFNVKVANGKPLQDFTIKMKNTTATSVTTAFDMNGLTTVWGPQTYTEGNGWNTHLLPTPFYMDNTSNLLIETCFCNGTNNSTTNAEMFNTATSFQSTVYKFTDSDPALCASSTGGTTTTSRPDVRLFFTPDTFPPVANFIVSNTLNCLGASVQFTDLSTYHPVTWLWNFGDGNTDTVQNPTYIYTSTGTFTVTLTVTNASGPDVMVISNLISIAQGPKLASCFPTVASTANDLGIYNVTFSSITNNSGSLIQGYQDYSCQFFTTVLSGSKQTLSVQTGPSWAENVRAWIDFNNDGSFNNSTELVLASDNKLKFHSREFIIPQNVVVDSMLRMRVASDYAGSAPPSPCGAFTYGQAEDYGVIILASTLPPEADFTYDMLDVCNGIVQFNDFSAYFPTTWVWNFGDGNTDSSSAQVTHIYQYSGDYTVTLMVSNLYGNDIANQTVSIDSIAAGFILPDTVEVGENIGFQNTSYGSDTYLWNFGDMLVSSIKDPSHAYSDTGYYQVSLTASNSLTTCQDSVGTLLYVKKATTGIANEDMEELFSVLPNPSDGKITISFKLQKVADLSISIIDFLGEVVYYEQVFSKSEVIHEIDISRYAQGMYMVRLRIEEDTPDAYQYSQKIIIQQ